MDAVQVEPVVPTIGLTAGRDAEITARIRVSASCTPLIWVAYSSYKEYPTMPHPLQASGHPYMVVHLFYLLLLVCGYSYTHHRNGHDRIPWSSPILLGWHTFFGAA